MTRRTIDMAIALLALLVFSIPLALITMAVALESPGGPFYRGWRVGKAGRLFRMWKFRTMVKDADQIGGAITSSDDRRITKLGRILRKTKLDELPQFLNLLLGDLTLIGPRPEAPGLAERYTPEQKKIFVVKPGITGPTQLRYTALEAEVIRDTVNPEQLYVECLLEEKVCRDLEYLETRTFFSDCLIVLKTISLMARSLAQTSPSPAPMNDSQGR